MYRVIFLKKAKQDLREVRLYYQSLRCGLAKKFQSDLMKIVDKLTENPLISGYRYNEIRVANFQQFPYQLHYSIEQNIVVVFAVVHASRSPEFVEERTD